MANGTATSFAGPPWIIFRSRCSLGCGSEYMSLDQSINLDAIMAWQFFGDESDYPDRLSNVDRSSCGSIRTYP